MSFVSSDLGNIALFFIQTGREVILPLFEANFLFIESSNFILSHGMQKTGGPFICAIYSPAIFGPSITSGFPFISLPRVQSNQSQVFGKRGSCPLYTKSQHDFMLLAMYSSSAYS